MKQLLELVLVFGVLPFALSEGAGEKQDSPPQPVPVESAVPPLTPEHPTIESTGTQRP